MANPKKHNSSKSDHSTKDGKVCVGIDMGTGSLAILARVDQEVIWSCSILLEAGTARLDERRTRRRMILTRLAHRAREYWWNQCAFAAGIPVLKTITKVAIDQYKISAVDDRLKREHPSDGDHTVYCGALLRIMILEGQIDKLADWQIYKAFHDAIQKRGYDPNVPWKTGYDATGDSGDIASSDEDDDAEKEAQKGKKSSEKDKDEEGKTRQRVDDFTSFMEINFKDRKHHYVCYFDAYKSGLWHPKKGIITKTQDYTAGQRALADWEGYIPPRQMVAEELTLLLNQIKKRFPKINPLHVMYGPSLTPYGSHPKHQPAVAKIGGQTGLIPGRPSDWEGVLGQKIPRFDNRGVGSCVLFPRFKVCKSPDRDKLKSMPDSDKNDPRELRLHARFNLLIRLRNLRVLKSAGIPEPLTPDELRAAYHHFEGKLRYGERDLKNWLTSFGAYKPAPGANLEAQGAKTSGRGAFSRPALRIICEWIYQGWTTGEARTEIQKKFICGNQDPLKGLTDQDFEWISRLKPAGWSESFYVPHRPVSQKYDGNPEKFVESIKYPVVRHRLGLMLTQLRQLKADLELKGYNLNDARVGVEVISDESKETFLGEKTKRELEKRIKDNAKKNEQVQKLCDEFKLKGHKNFERVKLAMSQGFIDPYDVKTFDEKDSEKARKSTMMRGIANELYDIDHIIPEAQGGPDEFYNRVLTKKEFNQKHKKNMTPYDYFHSRDDWRRFLDVLDQMPFPSADRLGVGNFKRNLMTSPNAADLVSKKTDLQATGYIEKSAQTLINLVFGWKESQLEGSTRHVVCVPGSLTAKLRARNQINELLYPRADQKSASSKSSDAKKPKITPLKNRANSKHHILDAAVISFVPEWGLNPKKNKFFALPKWADRDWFNERVVGSHEPFQWNVGKPSLYETRKSLVTIQSAGEATRYVAVKKHIHEKNSPSVEWKIGNLKAAVDDGMFNHPPFSTQKDAVTPLTTALKQALKGNPKKLPEEVLIEQNGHEIPLKSLKFLVEYSPFRHLVDDRGGVLESASHRGVIVYRDKSQKRVKWDVAVVAAWSSAEIVKEKVLRDVGADKVEFWNEGKILARGTVIEFTANGVDKFAPGTKLIISTTWENSQMGFVGEKALVMVTPLIEKGKIRVVPI
jgi:CRISPR-associated endonuclease Csn1